MQATYSGGSNRTQFLIGSGYHAQESLLPGDFKEKRPSFYLNINHSSDDNKFRIGFSSNYSYDDNNLTSVDLTQLIPAFPPNNPPLIDTNGELSWEYKGVAFFNPFGYLYQKYESKADNLLSNLHLHYEPVKNLQLRVSFGFNSINVNESSIVPKYAQDPQGSPTGYAEFSNRAVRSWTVEPFAEYKKIVGKG